MTNRERLMLVEEGQHRIQVQQAAQPWSKFNWILWGVSAALVAAFPLLVRSSYLINLAIMFFIWAVVAQGWNLLIGFSGIFSFGQMALFAVGGYASGFLSVYLGVSPWIGTVLGGLAAALAGLLIGLPVLRLRGVYVVLLTLAFHEILRILIVTDDSGFTGGGFGLQGIPGYGFDHWGHQVAINSYYYLAMVLFMITTYAIFRIVGSPVGLAFRALRDSEVYAVSRGVTPYSFKLLVFALSAFFSGVMGAFYAHYLHTISPSVLAFSNMTNLLAMVVIGGWGTFGGPIAGAITLTLLGELLREVEQFRVILLGAILATIVVLLPQGLLPIMKSGLKWWGDIWSAAGQVKE